MRVDRTATGFTVRLTQGEAEALAEIDGSDDGESLNELQHLLSISIAEGREEDEPDEEETAIFDEYNLGEEEDE